MKIIHLMWLSWLLIACAESANETSPSAIAESSDAAVNTNPEMTDVSPPEADGAVSLSVDQGTEMISTDPSAFIINEVLYDPGPEASGDANGDGNRDPYEDEFIEFINAGEAALNVGGLIIYDEQSYQEGTPRHLIPDNTILPPGGALVVFGGGSPSGDFGGAIVQVANGLDNQLNINNSGETVRVFNRQGVEILTFDGRPYSDNPNASYTRAPDVTGDFMNHSRLDLNGDDENDGVPFTPGLRIDGTPFTE